MPESDKKEEKPRPKKRATLKGAELREWREARQLTREEFAKVINEALESHLQRKLKKTERMSYRTIEIWEQNRRNMPIYFPLALMALESHLKEKRVGKDARVR